MILVSVTALALVVITMLAELWVARRNERALLALGAVAAPDPVYATMRWAYPGAFVLMAVEGAVSGRPSRTAIVAGALLWVAAKLLKYWAIATLSTRWSYRVLLLPGAALVADGPYRLLRHPNYVGVVGELVGVALITGARWTGPAATLFFLWLLRRRIVAEECALGLRAPHVSSRH